MCKQCRTLLFLALLGCSSFTFAQRRGGTQLQFEHSWMELMNANIHREIAASEGYAFDFISDHYPATGVVISHYLTDRWTVSFNFSSHFTQRWRTFGDQSKGRADLLYLTSAIGVRYIWQDAGLLYQFVEVDLGYSYGFVRLSDWQSEANVPTDIHFPTSHITLIGMRIGESYGIEAGLGYGYKGIVNLGFFFEI